MSSTPKDFDNLHKDKFYAWDNMKVAEIFVKILLVFLSVYFHAMFEIQSHKTVILDINFPLLRWIMIS